MSPQQAVSWTDAAQKILLPLLLSLVSVIGGWTATEIRNMNVEIQQLKIRVAELSIELKMHASQGAN
jgi:hypothetical protein